MIFDNNVLNLGSATAGTGGSGGSSIKGVFVGTVSENTSHLPTTRLDGTVLQNEDYVKVAVNANLPFTIDGITFTNKKDKCLYINNHWYLDPGAIQTTAETPVANSSVESISGTAQTQATVNIENKTAINSKQLDILTNISGTANQVLSRNSSNDALIFKDVSSGEQWVTVNNAGVLSQFTKGSITKTATEFFQYLETLTMEQLTNLTITFGSNGGSIFYFMYTSRNNTYTFNKGGLNYNNQITITSSSATYEERYTKPESSLSTSSENALQNKVITNALNTKQLDILTNITGTAGQVLARNDANNALIFKDAGGSSTKQVQSLFYNSDDSKLYLDSSFTNEVQSSDLEAFWNYERFIVIQYFDNTAYKNKSFYLYYDGDRTSSELLDFMFVYLNGSEMASSNFGFDAEALNLSINKSDNYSYSISLLSDFIQLLVDPIADEENTLNQLKINNTAYNIMSSIKTFYFKKVNNEYVFYDDVQMTHQVTTNTIYEAFNEEKNNFVRTYNSDNKYFLIAFYKDTTNENLYFIGFDNINKCILTVPNDGSAILSVVSSAGIIERDTIPDATEKGNTFIYTSDYNYTDYDNTPYHMYKWFEGSTNEYRDISYVDSWNYESNNFSNGIVSLSLLNFDNYIFKFFQTATEAKLANISYIETYNDNIVYRYSFSDSGNGTKYFYNVKKYSNYISSLEKEGIRLTIEEINSSNKIRNYLNIPYYSINDKGKYLRVIKDDNDNLTTNWESVANRKILSLVNEGTTETPDFKIKDGTTTLTYSSLLEIVNNNITEIKYEDVYYPLYLVDSGEIQFQVSNAVAGGEYNSKNNITMSSNSNVNFKEDRVTFSTTISAGILDAPTTDAIKSYVDGKISGADVWTYQSSTTTFKKDSTTYTSNQFHDYLLRLSNEIVNVRIEEGQDLYIYNGTCAGGTGEDSAYLFTTTASDPSGDAVLKSIIVYQLSGVLATNAIISTGTLDSSGKLATSNIIKTYIDNKVSEYETWTFELTGGTTVTKNVCLK